MASERKYGGYNYEFVGPVPEDFTCPICTLVQREAQQVTCCGKIYCKSCLKDLKNKGNRLFLCPCCQASLKGVYTFFPDKNAVSKIKHLSIYCTNKERGCKWVGNLKDLEEKHLPECPNEIVHHVRVQLVLFLLFFLLKLMRVQKVMKFVMVYMYLR